MERMAQFAREGNGKGSLSLGPSILCITIELLTLESELNNNREGRGSNTRVDERSSNEIGQSTSQWMEWSII